MSRARLVALADRKVLLAARAELDRAQVQLAVQHIKAIVVPTPDASQRGRVRPVAALLVGVLAPVLGMSRFGRWLRFASLAVTAFRIARSWRSVAR
ncbi:MAG: hypothetical protein ABI886_16160 [Betaproteobacteria bacterium]